MKVKSADFVQSATTTKQLPQDDKLEFLFCGRSNVGKSSFINMLVNRKALARTSQKPGKTQTLNIYSVNDNIYFVDVPGYGYAKVSKSIKEQFGVMIEDYCTNRKQLKAAFLLVDFRHEPTQDDCLMYEFLKYYNIEVKVIATKCDKVKNSQYFKNIKIIKQKLNFNDEDELIVTSSESKKGYDEVLATFDKYL